MLGRRSRAILAFECVHDIHGDDSITFGAFGDGNDITDGDLKEYLEDSMNVLVHETGSRYLVMFY